MGAKNFEHLILAYNAGRAFNRLVEDAEYESGHDDYNGTISTCSMGKCTLKFDKYSATNQKKAEQHVEKNDWGRKWFADYVDLGAVEYHVLTVKKRPVGKTAPSYKMKFVVKRCPEDYLGEPIVVQSFNTKTEADQFALEQTLKKTDPHKVVKEYVLEKGEACLTETYIETKVYKSKPTLKPMPNRKIVALHKYLFYGWASC